MSIEQAPCRAFFRAARWKGQAAHSATGAARATRTHCHPVNRSAGNSDSVIDRSLSGMKKTSARMSRRRRYRAWPSSGPACGASAGPDVAGTISSAVYPAFCTAAISVSAETAAGAVTVAVPVATLTAAMTSGPTAASFFSTRAAHAAQVMPPIDSSMFRIASRVTVAGSADTFPHLTSDSGR